MIKIFKYPIPVTDYFNMPIDNYFKIEMPLHAEILCLKMVKEKPYIWALIDDTKELKDRHFRIFTTGETIVENNNQFFFMNYIGTILSLEGSYVWHLCDCDEKDLNKE